MPDSDRIAVVIPARNAAKTIGAAVSSIQKQSLEDFEIVLVDHDSEDGTHRRMLEFARKDPRVQVHSFKGTFVGAANLAWQKSSAALVARMDADDFAYPRRLEKQRDFLLQNRGMVGCATGVRILKRSPDYIQDLPPDDGYARYETWVNSVVSSQDIARERFIDSPLPNPTTMVRREVLEKFGGFADPEWAEDYDLWLRLLDAGEILGKVDEVLLDWYDGDARATRTIDRYSLEQFQRAKAYYLSRLEQVRKWGVVICGAGPIGKQFARFLEERDITIRAFVEVNERQIGNRIRGIPILDSRELGNFQSEAVAIGAVGLTGARQKIRDLATSSGFVEGNDFFCVA